MDDALNSLEGALAAVNTAIVQVRIAAKAAGAVAFGVDAPKLTLHEAMAVVLRQRGNEWTKMSVLAEMITTRGLYKKNDGSPLEPNQLHARVNRPTYRDMFEKNGPYVRLRTDPVASK